MQRVWTAITPEITVDTKLGNIRHGNAGYGYGLRLAHDPAIGWLVTHSGGLPGFGSNMMWSLKHKVALIALGNVTYCPLNAANRLGFELLFNTQPAISAQPATASQALTEIAHRLVQVLSSWANGKDVPQEELDALFAINVFLDFDLKYQKHRVELLSGFLPFTINTVTQRNPAEADVKFANRRELALNFLLAPSLPLRIQSYTLNYHGHL